MVVFIKISEYSYTFFLNFEALCRVDHNVHSRFQAKFDPSGSQMVVMVADSPLPQLRITLLLLDIKVNIVWISQKLFVSS